MGSTAYSGGGGIQGRRGRNVGRGSVQCSTESGAVSDVAEPIIIGRRTVVKAALRTQ